MGSAKKLSDKECAEKLAKEKGCIDEGDDCAKMGNDEKDDAEKLADAIIKASSSDGFSVKTFKKETKGKNKMKTKLGKSCRKCYMACSANILYSSLVILAIVL